MAGIALLKVMLVGHVLRWGVPGYPRHRDKRLGKPLVHQCEPDDDRLPEPGKHANQHLTWHRRDALLGVAVRGRRIDHLDR